MANAQYGKVETYSLCPLSGDKWQLIRDHIASDKPKSETQGLSADAVREAEDPSMYDVTQSLEGDGGVVLDAHREVRVKLYIGQVSSRTSSSLQWESILITAQPSSTYHDYSTPP